ncbi:MAG: hypothetical protein ACI9P5_004185, partial [Saprospiraceae bacterium]
MRIFFTLLLTIFCFGLGFSQNTTCSTADLACTGMPITYEANINSGTAEIGPDYGCLLTQPNPAWFFLSIDQGGNLEIEISNSNDEDIDFILYGPFPDQISPCTAQLTAGNTEDCSYSTSSTETANIVGAISGEFYLMMITNFSNNTTSISFDELPSSTATTVCGVSFTALADLCINAGVQAVIGSGTPTSGVYSGLGVTDGGNGISYSFDPDVAGIGVHTITYSYTDTNGDITSASDDVEVFALPVVTFTALADLCIDAGVQSGEGGGTPTGGVYSGPGVTDIGDGMTYDFDPATAGVGVHTLTYTYTDANGCAASTSDDVEVFSLPVVTFIALADLCIDEGVQAGLGSGTPTGGVYSGAGVTDDANGMTYSFDPATAGVGVHTITYSYTDGNNCSSSASDDVEVFGLPVVTFTALADLCVDAGVQAGLGGGAPVPN